jgi:hypothetical protein
MPDGVDTPVDPVESPHAGGLVDGVPTVPELPEFPRRDDAVLPGRALGQTSVPNL